MKRVYLRDLKLITEEMEKVLREKGFDIEIIPYFAYGAYSYVFKFYNKDKSIRALFSTNLGTKKECYERLITAYYKTIALKDEYLPL